MMNMPSIPRDYLEKLAEQKGLNEFTKPAFVERLVDRDRGDMKVAIELGISRSLYSSRMTKVYKVFGLGEGRGPGKAKDLFYKVLDMYEKAHPGDAVAYTHVKDAVDALARETQVKISGWIKKKCSYMQILDMSHPIEVQEIFTQVKITERILSKIQMEMPDVVEKIQKTNKISKESKHLSLLPDAKIDGIDVLNISRKILILGKPGAGKTTFLKHVGALINSSKILPGHIPVFISLKDFQNKHEDISLKKYIENEFLRYGVIKDELDRLLLHSRLVFLLDGLDEIREKEIEKVNFRIRELLDSDVKDNRFIITCRIAANKSVFEGFTEAEICDFTDVQIKQFARNWFQSKRHIHEEAESHKKLEKFIKRIEDEEGIKDLASNPLLLTLLCIVFLNSGDFPNSRYELYEEGLLVLLQKWDESRNIERAEVYKGLSRKRKEDLLSKIAFETFERDAGLFRKKTVENIIKDYIQNLPRFINQPEEIDVDSLAILESIIVQHGLITEITKGIYGFSHRTFHEYFVANSIANSSSLEERDLHLKMVVNNIHEHRWREVFLLSVSIPKDADKLLLSAKSKIDFLIKDCKEIEPFITWLKSKISSDKEFKGDSELKAAGQEFYFQLIVMNRISDLYKRSFYMKLDGILIVILRRSIVIQENVDFISALSSKDKIDELQYKIENGHRLVIQNIENCTKNLQTVGLREDLIILRKQLAAENSLIIKWWERNGDNWINSLREILVLHRNIGKNWNFDRDTLNVLRSYYNASTLIHECLASDCYITRKVRENLEKYYLLPMD